MNSQFSGHIIQIYEQESKQQLVDKFNGDIEIEKHVFQKLRVDNPRINMTHQSKQTTVQKVTHELVQ